MQRSLLAILLTTAVSAALAADVGVSISVGQPGFYGQIDIGNAPRPVLIYPQPVLIQRVQVIEPVQPIYLHVPPGHAKNWKKHCQKYDACARPVYFVKDDWYSRSTARARETAKARESSPRRDCRRITGTSLGRFHPFLDPAH
jgi:hypothetical protein